MPPIDSTLSHLAQVEALRRRYSAGTITDEDVRVELTELARFFAADQYVQEAQARQQAFEASDYYEDSVVSAPAETLMGEVFRRFDPEQLEVLDLPLDRSNLGLAGPAALSGSPDDLFRAFEVALLAELGVPSTTAFEAVRRLPRLRRLKRITTPRSAFFFSLAVEDRLRGWPTRLRSLLEGTDAAPAMVADAGLRAVLRWMRHRDHLELIFQADAQIANGMVGLVSQALGEVHSAASMAL